jgi:hypothetical protein
MIEPLRFWYIHKVTGIDTKWSRVNVKGNEIALSALCYELAILHLLYEQSWVVSIAALEFYIVRCLLTDTVEGVVDTRTLNKIWI